ncbi:hypothetical protein [Nocardia brevicatena]|uniref:hypothetical protein n=1 Tax=Nocardia brevicatena TaxID=37327 RepID=UPI0003127CA2|nr:hypothetical protein [Nocardia brevicatena]
MPGGLARFGALAEPRVAFGEGAEPVVNDPEFGAARPRKRIPSANVEIYPNIGHDLLWANPEEVIPRFLTFADNYDQIWN